jgi:hypothetical protein
VAGGRKAGEAAVAAKYLDEAIDQYERGRVRDLNEYFAACNLPMLLRTRGGPGDAERAARVAVGVVAACERGVELKTADEWVNPTLLGAAFDAGDVDKARALIVRVKAHPEDWKLETTLDDLRDRVALHPAGSTKEQLEGLLADLSGSAAKK